MPRSVASTSASLGSFLVGQIIAIMGVASVDLNSGACQGRAWYNCQESQQKPYKVLDCYIVTSYPKTTTDNNTLLLKLRQGSQTDLVWWPILLRVVLSTQATGMGLVAKLCCATSTLIASPDCCVKGLHPGLSKKQHQWCFESNWKKWIATSLQKIANPWSLEHLIIGSDGKVQFTTIRGDCRTKLHAILSDSSLCQTQYHLHHVFYCPNEELHAQPRKWQKMKC